MFKFLSLNYGGQTALDSLSFMTSLFKLLDRIAKWLILETSLTE